MILRKLALIMAMVVVSCSAESDKVEDFGLKLVEISMEPEALGNLNNSVGAKRPFPGQFEIDGERYSVGLSYAGKSSLYAFKRSWQVYFKNRKFRGHKEYRISSQKLDDSLVRTVLGFEIYNKHGVDAPKAEAISLYVNGDYLGVYVLIEPVNTDFFQNRDIPVDEIYKAKFANADFTLDQMNRLSESFSVQTENKDFASMLRLYQAVNDISIDSDQRKQLLESLLDVEQYLRYIAISVFINHQDGFDNNFFLSRSLWDKRFRMTPWDLDRLFESRFEYIADDSIFGRNQLTKILLSFPAYRERYIEILGELVKNEPLEGLLNRVEEISGSLSNAYQADPILGKVDQDVKKAQLIENISTWISALSAELSDF